MSNDQGREKCAQEIRKAHQAQDKEIDPRFAKHLSAISLFQIVRDHRRRLKKGDAQQLLTRQVLKAVKPRNLQMQANGVPKSLQLIKLAHEKPLVLDGDFMTKLSFPPQSSNSANDRTRANDGARLAHDAVDDESTTGTRATIIGSQPIRDVASSASINAAVDAIKKDLARGARPFLA